MSTRPHPTASYSVTLRIETQGVPGTLGKVTSAIGETGGVIGAIDIVSSAPGCITREITIAASDDAHEQTIADRVGSLEGVRVVSVADRTFQVHAGGKV